MAKKSKIQDPANGNKTGRNALGRFVRGEEARESGRKGGKASGGNFERDPERARTAGKKGGSRSF